MERGQSRRPGRLVLTLSADAIEALRFQAERHQRSPKGEATKLILDGLAFEEPRLLSRDVVVVGPR